MNTLELDLQHIKQYAIRHQNDFRNFRAQVKKIPVTDFDQLALPIIQKITDAIDCTQCGNCCRIQEPGISQDELTVLAQQKGITPKEFSSQFVATDKDGIQFLCKQPCIFLQNTTCSIYNHRPASCADYPGLTRPGLKWRMNQLEFNYGICPIVFNVVETLKALVQ